MDFVLFRDRRIRTWNEQLGNGKQITVIIPFTMQIQIQWEFQDPKMEVPPIYKACVRPKFQGIYPQNMAKNMVLTYLHKLDPGDLPLNIPSGNLT